jgi:acid phosphatase class B
MAELILSEQDIVNAICIDQSQKHNIPPEKIAVELVYDDDKGFSAELEFHGQQQVLTSFDMIQAIRFWIKEVLNQDPYAAGIKLLLDREEGIIADIQ